MHQTPAGTSGSEDLVNLLCERAVTRANHGYTFEEKAGLSRLTFADLDRRARRLALQLRIRQPRAESAILCYPPGVDFLVGFFGSLYAGITAVPAYPPRPRRADDRLEAIAADSPRAIVLTTPELLQDKGRLAAQTPRLAALSWLETDGGGQESGVRSQGTEIGDQESGESWEPRPLPSGRPAVLQYTSGSTARPKGVMLNHASIMHNLRRMCEVLGLRLGDSGVCWLPAFHDMGLIGNLLQALFSGLDLTLLSPAAVAQDPLCWLETISKTKAYISGGPGFAFQHCLERVRAADRDRLDLSSWRVAYVGAEPVSAALLSRFTEYFAPCGFRPQTFFPTYGLAEGTLMITGGDCRRARRTSVHFSRAHWKLGGQSRRRADEPSSAVGNL